MKRKQIRLGKIRRHKAISSGGTIVGKAIVAPHNRIEILKDRVVLFSDGKLRMTCFLSDHGTRIQCADEWRKLFGFRIWRTP